MGNTEEHVGAGQDGTGGAPRGQGPPFLTSPRLAWVPRGLRGRLMDPGTQPHGRQEAPEERKDCAPVWGGDAAARAACTPHWPHGLHSYTRGGALRPEQGSAWKGVLGQGAGRQEVSPKCQTG